MCPQADPGQDARHQVFSLSLSLGEFYVHVSCVYMLRMLHVYSKLKLLPSRLTGN